MKFILASQSPRRHQLFKKLLQDLNLSTKDFEIIVPNIDESCLDGELPRDCAVRLAKEKAMSVVCPQILTQDNGTLVVTADTIVVLNNIIYGKPVDAKDAKQMLTDLRGKTHEVITGYCLLYTDQNGKQTIINDADSSFVTFRNYSHDEIIKFIDTGIPMDKAGAYAVQEDIYNFIDTIQGSYPNVMGLPVEKIKEQLENTLTRQK